jgi:hypothetical protein
MRQVINRLWGGMVTWPQWRIIGNEFVTINLISSMYVFGGVKAEGNTAEFFQFNIGNVTNKSIFLSVIETNLWSKIEAQSSCKPSSRSYMTVTPYNGGIYILGGKSNIGYKNSFFKYTPGKIGKSVGNKNLALNVWKIVWSVFELEGRSGSDEGMVT